MRPLVVSGGRSEEPTDHRVAAVLDVLAGRSAAEVALRHEVEPALVHRWVRAFVEAGTAQVTNRPDPAAAQQRDRFLAAFAHEVRTPLTVAQGWVGLLKDGEVPAAQVAVTVERLHAALGRLSEHTLDVELLAAASLGRLTVRHQPVRVRELVAAIEPVGSGQSRPPEPDDVGGDGPDTRLSVDPRLMARVVRDLWQVGEMAPTPRSLRLEVATVTPWVELRVVRDADPIEPRVLQALFEPFDLNDDDTGVTIGLYLARALAVAHGGTIGVTQDDHTAVLWVRVPIATPRPTPEETR